MSKRSFMRGFGIGVLFATVILGISGLIRTSDAAVVKRARQLGMDYVQEEPLFDKRSDPVSKGAVGIPGSAGPTDADPTKLPSTPKPQRKKAETTQKPSKMVRQEEADQEELKQEKDKIRKDYEDAVRSFTIEAGEWSDVVSRKLERLGIVSDAEKFDDYLEAHGYSDDIIAGSFQVSKDASFEEIAREITGK